MSILAKAGLTRSYSFRSEILVLFLCVSWLDPLMGCSVSTPTLTQNLCTAIDFTREVD